MAAHYLDTYPGTWRPDRKIIDEEYKEGLYVGYRWVDKQKRRPLFAFGHGLSYTTFRLSDLQASSTTMTREDSITFTVKVTNTGKRDGATVVQLYIHDEQASLDRPYKELKGFSKVFLRAGETKQVTITIDDESLRYYDDRIGIWTSEPGGFKALVGFASDNLPLNIKFRLQ